MLTKGRIEYVRRGYRIIITDSESGRMWAVLSHTVEACKVKAEDHLKKIQGMLESEIE